MSVVQNARVRRHRVRALWGRRVKVTPGGWNNARGSRGGVPLMGKLQGGGIDRERGRPAARGGSPLAGHGPADCTVRKR
ncbi:hypothetical protein GCM10027072_73420 [Streptomyces bullii]